MRLRVGADRRRWATETLTEPELGGRRRGLLADVVRLFVSPGALFAELPVTNLMGGALALLLVAHLLYAGLVLSTRVPDYEIAVQAEKDINRTAEQLARQLGMTVSGARQHLGALVADGLVEASEMPTEAPRRGRRTLLYSATPAADSRWATARSDCAAWRSRPASFSSRPKR